MSALSVCKIRPDLYVRFSPIVPGFRYAFENRDLFHVSHCDPTLARRFQYTDRGRTVFSGKDWPWLSILLGFPVCTDGVVQLP